VNNWRLIEKETLNVNAHAAKIAEEKNRYADLLKQAGVCPVCNQSISEEYCYV